MAVGLHRSEFLRARSRRLVSVVLVGGVILIVVAIVIAAVHSHRPTPNEVAAAQTQFNKELSVCLSGKYVGPSAPVGYDSLEQYCDEVIQSNAGDADLKQRDAVNVLVNSGAFVILVGALVGASLAGADWSAGSMATLLTWEPRRIRVLLVRAEVIVVVVVIVTIPLQALLSILFKIAVVIRGSTVGSPPGLWGHVAGAAVRVSVMAAAFALIATALATLGRSTVAALGILFGYFILFEGVIAGFAPGIQDRLLVRAATAVVSNHPIIEFNETPTVGASFSAPPTVVLGIGEAWAVVACYTIALLLLALLVFRSRDVT
jgi:ABC-2 type transport system permease protein